VTASLADTALSERFLHVPVGECRGISGICKPGFLLGAHVKDVQGFTPELTTSDGRPMACRVSPANAEFGDSGPERPLTGVQLDSLGSWGDGEEPVSGFGSPASRHRSCASHRITAERRGRLAHGGCGFNSGFRDWTGDWPVLPTSQPVESDITDAGDWRHDLVVKLVAQDPRGLLGIVANHRRKLPATPLDAAVLNGLKGTRHRVKPELLDEQLQQILQAGPHTCTPDGEVQLA